MGIVSLHDYRKKVLRPRHVRHYNTRKVDMSSIHENAMEPPSPAPQNAGMDDPVLIGRRLKAIRRHFGEGRESQEVFAGRFGAEKTAWSNWETGYRVIPVEIADKMCRQLGISLDWLYRGNGIAMPATLLRELEPKIRKTA